MRGRRIAGWSLAGALACGPGGGEMTAGSTSTTATTVEGTGGTTTGASPTSGDASTAGETSTTTGGSSSTSTSLTTTLTGSSGESSTGDGTSTSTGEETSSGSGPKFDIGVLPCDPDETCCKQDGFIPPHELLESFLAVYPPVNMPKDVAAVQAFEPMADGHVMAYSMENVGNELVDAGNGGVIEANIQAGRDLSRMAAEGAVPPGATVLEIREDPVIIEDLGTPAPCIGVGWGWGSIVFEAVDESIGELVYLYIGYCSSGDVEAFYYSEQAVELCPAPG
jgi:hypothetical protein